MRTFFGRTALGSVITASLLNFFVFRNVFLHMATSLRDFNDYPFVVWVIYQNISHMKALQWAQFFDGTIFYPHKGILLFSDLYLPVSLIATPLSVFFASPIFVFNLIFALTLVLNAISAYYFWKAFFSSSALFFATVATCTSTFFFAHSVHFQVLSFWPMLFALGILVRKHYTTSNALRFGLLLTLQFLSGVYFAIFSLFFSALWYAIAFPASFKERKRLLTHAGVALAVFLLTSGWFIANYMRVKQAYGIQPQPGEYVDSSAGFTDYWFATSSRSMLSDAWPFSVWNSYNQGQSLFPGITLIVLSVLVLVQLKHTHKDIDLRVSFTRDKLFFGLLLVFSFIASLGPRLVANGTYLNVPLPYIFALKLLPILEPIRVNIRWTIFVTMALIYFSSAYITKLGKKGKVVMPALLLLLIAEVLPLKSLGETNGNKPEAYQALTVQCSGSSQVLLEYPLTLEWTPTDVEANLTYRTQMLLAGITHHCILVNGYSGYTPKHYDQYDQELTSSIHRKDAASFWNRIRDKHINMIKINKQHMRPEHVETLLSFLEQGSSQILWQDENTDIVKLQP